jgi:alginate O-acetyltransferase complex protein AlgJ
MKHRGRNVFLVVLFGAVLLAPTAATVLKLNPMRTLDEKRALAKRPTASLWRQHSLKQVPVVAQQWEKYFNDNFGFRKLLIGTYRLLSFTLLKTSPNPAVVVGTSTSGGRWLFFDAKAANDGMGFDSLLGRRPYSNAELQSIATNLRAQVDLAKNANVKLMLAICPDKQTMYPEYLPSRLRPAAGTQSRLDQFWGVAANVDGLHAVDLRVALREAKTDSPLYYASDTHWNVRGAAVGYVAIANVLNELDSTVGPVPLASLSWAARGERTGDLTRLLGIPVLSGERNLVAVLPQNGQRRGKLLVLGDSFSDALQQYFELNFAVVKRVRGARGARDTLLTKPLLETEKPDVVLIEAVERYWTA